MAITIGSTSFPALTAQPFGYEETNTRAGQTARKWLVTGLLRPSEWLDLLDEYDGWRDERIDDEPTETSNSVGTTVAFSGTGPGGQAWTSVACWFITAPQAEQSGGYLSVSVELVDATEALQVLGKASENTGEELPDFGTYTLGTTTLTLVKPIDAYGTGPSVQLTAAGKSYTSGPLVVTKVRDIEGTTILSGWNGVRTWYETITAAVPAVGSWFPIEAPSATAEDKIIEGVKTTVYTVSTKLEQIK